MLYKCRRLPGESAIGALMKFFTIALALELTAFATLALGITAEKLTVRSVAAPQNFSMYALGRDSFGSPLLMRFQVRASVSTELAAPPIQLGTR